MSRQFFLSVTLQILYGTYHKKSMKIGDLVSSLDTVLPSQWLPVSKKEQKSLARELVRMYSGYTGMRRTIAKVVHFSEARLVSRLIRHLVELL